MEGVLKEGVLMIISTEELAALIREVEIEDPIDYGDLPYAEDELRLLVSNQICEIAERAERQLGEEGSGAVLLAVAAKLILENLVLHIKLMQAQGGVVNESSEALFERLRGRPGL
jgi:hypothetical protein